MKFGMIILILRNLKNVPLALDIKKDNHPVIAE
jgi:hypothetical protein